MATTASAYPSPKRRLGDFEIVRELGRWMNCDDGWDGYLRGANGVTTTLENC
jgi:hypothetical protein